jgi:glycine C-acetyltransferase
MPDASEIGTPTALAGSLREYRNPHGADLLKRVQDFFRWQDLRRRQGYWPYARATEEAPQPRCAIRDDAGHRFSGVNFGSQDYLSLASHPAIKEAAKAAIDEYGVHSAGSPAFLGNTRYSLALERTIAEFLGMEHALLFPTGYAAGAGAIKGLVRPDDHVVIDGLAHACLHDGAAAATSKVHLHGHLNMDSLRRHLQRIRAQDRQNGILVVTESLFSMDSDTPDIARIQDLCHEYEATLLLDMAHDFGNIGADGRGHIGLQKMVGLVDVVMGSFSKTFASNGGFVAVNSRGVREYLRYFSPPGTFSNAMSPVQAAVVAKAFEIIRSPEGAALRAQLMGNVCRLRDNLQGAGLDVLGSPSAIVPVKVGREAFARTVSRLLPDLGLVANLVEFPAVARGSARFRLQVMANHSQGDVDEAAARLASAVEQARSLCPDPQGTAEPEDVTAAVEYP